RAQQRCAATGADQSGDPAAARCEVAHEGYIPQPLLRSPPRKRGPSFGEINVLGPGFPLARERTDRVAPQAKNYSCKFQYSLTTSWPKLLRFSLDVRRKPACS